LAALDATVTVPIAAVKGVGWGVVRGSPDARPMLTLPDGVLVEGVAMERPIT
jgi:hypothetical protein